MQTIFLVCDRIPTGMLGAYGSEWVETPNIDRFAHHAVVFDSYIPDRVAADACRWSAWSGLGAASPQDDSATELGRRLREAGVATAFLTDRPSAVEDAPWHADFTTTASFATPHAPESEWASLEDLASSDHYRLPPADHPQFAAWTSRWRMQLGRDRTQGDEAPRSLEALFAAGSQWLAEHRDRASVLWLDIGLAEADWLPPSGFRDVHLEEDADAGSLRDPIPGRVGELYSTEDLERLRAGWADRIAYFDAMFGVFLASVDESRSDPQLIVFVAESGEPLGERGVVGTEPDYLYGDRLRAPLVVRTSLNQGGFRTPQFVQTRDLHSMIAGTHLPLTDAGVVVGIVAGKPEACRLAVVSKAEDARTIGTRRWTYVRRGDSQELFSQPDDRLHVNDVASHHPEVVDELEQMINSQSPA